MADFFFWWWWWGGYGFSLKFHSRFQCGVSVLLCGLVSVPVSKWFHRSGFQAISKIRFQGRFQSGFNVGQVAWFQVFFEVCFSVGIFPNADDVLFRTGFRGVSMSTRPVSESSCPERGSTPVSNLVSEYGFRFSFRLRFQSRPGQVKV